MIQRLKAGKRLCSLFLSLYLLCSLFMTVPVKAAETDKDWAYVISEDGTVKITGYNGKATEIEIPGMIEGKSVTSIGKWAFYEYRNLTSIKIPSSVTNIGERAFTSCSSLTSINVAENSQNYTSRDGILYDKSCKTLICCPGGKEGTVTIPSSVTRIWDEAFFWCSSLTSIEIPSSVTRIGKSAFWGCNSLTSIEIPSGVTSIKQTTFAWCSSLTSIEIPNSVTDIGMWAFYDCNSLTSIKIPNSVTNIGSDAFFWCRSLKSIEIPSSVTSIADYTFSGCSSLTSIIIPSSVTSIVGYRVFYGCSSLTIYGESGSYAEEYAEDCGIRFRTGRPCAIHTPVPDRAIAATCTIAGKTEGSHCSVCDEIIKPQEVIRATGHTYKKVTTKATTKKNGTIEEKCSACGYVDKTKSTTTIYAASGIKLSKTSFTYNGKNQKPTIIVQDSKGRTLPAGSYKITFSQISKNVGEYTVTIALQGNYSGTVKLTYQIKPKSTTISKLTAKKEGFTVKWKKQTSQTTGYEIQYSTSSKFKGAKTVTIKKNKTTSKSITKLKTGKKYYVRIRTYKNVKVNGKNTKIYSGWSKVKSVETKK